MSEEVMETNVNSTPIESGEQAPTPNEDAGYKQQSESPFANIQTTPSGVGKDVLVRAVQEELDAGRITFEQANSMLAADGMEPLNSPSSFDKAFPKLDLNQYQVGSLLSEGQDISGPMDASKREAIQNIAQVGKMFQTWASEARFPKEAGSFVIQEGVRTANQLEKMNEPQKQLWNEQQQKVLQDMYKGEYKMNVALARKLVTELEAKQPGLIDFLEESGVGNSAMVINQFVIQAKRLFESQKHFDPKGESK